MTSPPNLPKSIEVWVCPECGRANSHSKGQQGALCGCTGWVGGAETRRVRATYVLAEPTDEMVDRLARFIADISPEDRARGLRPISSEFERARRLLAAALSTEAPDA